MTRYRLVEHALHVLQKMLTVDDRGNRELHLKSSPSKPQKRHEDGLTCYTV